MWQASTVSVEILYCNNIVLGIDLLNGQMQGNYVIWKNVDVSSWRGCDVAVGAGGFR